MIILQILQQVKPKSMAPYRVVETVQTVDGPRSRLTYQSFATFEQAQEYVEKTEKRYVGRT